MPLYDWAFAAISLGAGVYFASISGDIINRGWDYPPTYAAAVEACASTGGSIMPPVMGAAGFIMASFLNVPYATVVSAAILPAVLF